jgi:hypothetical protein
MEPLKYAMRMPGYEAVEEIVLHSFELEKMDAFLRSRRNYLYRIIESSKEQFEGINKDRIDYILTHKHIIVDKIECIKNIESNIVSR